MKKIILIVSLGVLFGNKAHCKEIEGKIIRDKDTINVVLIIPITARKIPNYAKLQSKIKYINPDGKKDKLKPQEANEIQFKYLERNIRMVSRKYTFDGIGPNDSEIFLKIEIDDYMKLYSFYYTFYNGQSMSITRRYVLQKGNEPIKTPQPNYFKKDMLLYFKDCTELSEKIENKELKKDDFKQIVNDYNSYCK